MTDGAAGTADAWDPEQLRQLVAAYVARRGWEPSGGHGGVLVVDAWRVVPGRPGVVGVVADVLGRRVVLPIGLRALGDEARFLPGAKDPVLGLLDDDQGLAVAFVATADEETATSLLQAVVGIPPGAGGVRLLDPGPTSSTFVFGDEVALTVHDLLADDLDGRERMRVVEALAAAGFTGLPPTLAVWRRQGWVLGTVRAVPSGVVPAAGVALRSVRAVVSCVDEPADPSGGFAPEATALGGLCGRLHVALDRAFGRWPADPAAWSARVAGEVGRRAPHLAERPDVRRVLDDLAVLPVPCSAIRTYGDLCLGRVARTAAGWILVEPGEPGAGPSADGPGGEPFGVRRSPLADVADMLWAFGRAAAAGLAEHERDEAVPGPVAAVRAEAWERRVRRAFIAGYLAAPGVAALVPSDRRALRTITAALELERAVRSAPPGG